MRACEPRGLCAWKGKSARPARAKELVHGLWGDGASPVFRDSSSDGKLSSVRVELGVPEIVSRTRGFEAQLGS